MEVLHLSENRIGDIYPLAQNDGPGTGDDVFLVRNPLSPDSIKIYTPQLKARGVALVFGTRAVGSK